MSDSDLGCEQIERVLFAMDEDFPDAMAANERAIVEEHLKHCAECRDLREKERQLTSLLTDTSKNSIQFTELRDKKANSQTRFWKTIATVAASIAIVISICALSMLQHNRQLAKTLRRIEENENLDRTASRLANLGSYSYRPVATNVSFNSSNHTQNSVLLKSMNHYDVPVGVVAIIELTETGSIKAVGPATFGIDQISGQWKITLIDGQARVSVFEGHSISVAGKQGVVKLDAGAHLVSTGAGTFVQQLPESTEAPKVMQSVHDSAVNVDGILDQANSVFRAGSNSSEKDFEEAARLYQKVLDHSDSSKSQRLSAMFYLSVALANSKNYQSALDTATAFENQYPHATSEITLAIICESNWHLGYQEAARNALNQLKEKFPGTPFLPGLDSLLSKQRDDIQQN